MDKFINLPKPQPVFMKEGLVITFFLMMNLFSHAQDRITGLPFATRSPTIQEESQLNNLTI